MSGDTQRHKSAACTSTNNGYCGKIVVMCVYRNVVYDDDYYSSIYV